MEKITQAEISNKAPRLVEILENARNTHIGILSVLSTPNPGNNPVRILAQPFRQAQYDRQEY